ncbi:MAG TPA: hypothetical protein VHL54_12440 [Actinomycetota bacterium]|nr:hypothetical protein [Actinomycetota bacterium]
MVRAVVLIGVAQAGILDTLQAVHDGVRAMEKWALDQGIDRDLVKVLSDESGPVEVRDVKKAVKELVDLSTVEQLIVYFAGHGVNISRGEYWLLSAAPEDSNEAVNVSGSVELARYCGIPHVVLISDACRTAAEGIQAQGIRGSEIFPNLSEGGIENPVDVFFACALGAPALEVKDPKQAAAGFRAIYTDSLVEALQGRKDVLVKDPEEPAPIRLIEVAGADEGARRGIIRPWPLSFHLQSEVLDRLISADVKPGVSQTPIARINSRGTWLAEVPAPQPPPMPASAPRVPSPAAAPPPAAPPARGRRRGTRPEKPRSEEKVPAQVGRAASVGAGGTRRTAAPGERLMTSSRSLLRASLKDGLVVGGDAAALGPDTSELLRTAGRVFEPFGPSAFETRCGFKVRGTSVDSVLCAGADAEIVDPEHRIVRVDAVAGPAANVSMQFSDGTGVVLPAIPHYLAAISVEAGEVVDVSYEPSDNSPRWTGIHDRVDELRSLRALMASSARLGVLRLSAGDAELLADHMKVGDGLDPTMAVYAAYAFDDLQRKGLIRKVEESMKKDLGLRLFDVELLNGDLRGRRVAAEKGLYPFVPLLSSGWALLGAHRVELPPGLAELGRHRVESLWTLFDPSGVDLVRTAIQNKEID